MPGLLYSAYCETYPGLASGDRVVDRPSTIDCFPSSVSTVLNGSVFLFIQRFLRFPLFFFISSPVFFCCSVFLHWFIFFFLLFPLFLFVHMSLFTQCTFVLYMWNIFYRRWPILNKWWTFKKHNYYDFFEYIFKISKIHVDNFKWQ